MNNFIYGGVQIPYWQQIDKIHQGSFTNLKANDEILLGRYVLVQYVNEVFSQDRKNELMQIEINSSEYDMLTLNEQSWIECYKTDNHDYDGMVCKKIYDINKQTILYQPIANLSTTYSKDYVINSIGFGLNNDGSRKYTVAEVLGKGFFTDNNTVKDYIDNKTEVIGILIGEDTNKSVRDIAAEEINTIIGGVNDEDTITNIESLINYVNENGDSLQGIENEITDLQILIGKAAKEDEQELSIIDKIEIYRKELETIIKKYDAIEVETLPTSLPSDSLKYAIYSIPVLNEDYRALYVYDGIYEDGLPNEGEIKWRLVGYTTPLRITWETF